MLASPLSFAGETNPGAKSTAGGAGPIINSFEQRRNSDRLSFAVTFQ
jgi:hypothetical protein